MGKAYGFARVKGGRIALHVDEDFDAVGRYYDVFEQTSDEEVLCALREQHEPAE